MKLMTDSHTTTAKSLLCCIALLMSFNIFATPSNEDKGQSGASGVAIHELRICGARGNDLCKVGSIGPGGGPIFFVDYHDQYAGFNYLEAAPTDITAIQVWCNDSSTSIPTVAGWAAKAVGKGHANTEAMLIACSSGAAYAAHNYISRSKSDYFLPSLGELMLMYTNLLQAGVGGFANDSYWSSTEFDSSIAWNQNFGDGDQGNEDKDETFRVLAVRAF